MSGYPPEIERLHETLSSLKGIEDVCSGIDNLDGLGDADVRSVAMGHLPVGTLLRTQGGLKDESMLQFEFRLDGTPASLISLEFLAWFIRDQARAGNVIQLRPFALPPSGPGGVQLGQTLKFHIDYFIVNPTDSLRPFLDRIWDLTESLRLAMDLYRIPTRGT
ncbi:MAG: hypothetical protein U0176_01925 [Bacteroidia bacterium]